MVYTALYRTWRPLDFDDVIGQDHITTTLKNEVELGRIGHAYLFCGSRGTGKTSTARILSRAVNCISPKSGNPCNECENCKGILDGTILDITEIDAASNNGVDNIRDLREEARFSGSRLKSRIYIVDEVHMLTTNAFNALLKILEEPPSHVIFILATTEAHKVPDTILSRCQRFDFKRIDTQDIETQVLKILSANSYSIEDSGIRLIAEKADGSMRDALSLLDQCMAIGGKTLSYEEISSFLGFTDYDFLRNIVQSINEQDTAGALRALSEYVDAGKNVSQLIEDFISFVRSLLMCKYVSNPFISLGVSPDTGEGMAGLAAHFTPEKLLYITDLAIKANNQVRYSKNARVIFELALIKMINPIYLDSSESIACRLSDLESTLSGRTVTADKKTDIRPKPVSKIDKHLPDREKEAENKNSSSDIVKKVKNAQADIVNDLFSHNQLQTALAFEKSVLEEKDGNLCVLFSGADELQAFKSLLNDKNLERLKLSINKFTGLSPEIYIGEAQKDKTDKNDHLLKLSKKLNE